PLFPAVPGSSEPTFADTIRVRRAGSTITVSVDVGGDALPNRQSQDAFVSAFNVADVTSVNVLATPASFVTISAGLGVNVNATGAANSTLVFEGTDLGEAITVSATSV